MLCLRNITACVLFTILYIDFNQVETRSVKSKRAIWNIAYQLTYYFGAGRATALLDYGCFCGWYGSGAPVDGVDQCCKDHDDCYGRVDECWPKIWPYSYELQNGTVNCQNRASSCKGRICMCDKVFVDCLHNNTYNPDNHDVDQDKHCQGCCKNHEDCYDREVDCLPKILFYEFNLGNTTVNCENSPNSCEGRVCKCDKTFVDCLQNKEFKPDYYNADQDEYCDDGCN